MTAFENVVTARSECGPSAHTRGTLACTTAGRSTGTPWTRWLVLAGERVPTSKSEAAAWRDRLRSEIRAGTFVDPGTPVPAAPADMRLTFGDICDQYLRRHVQSPTRRMRGRREMEILIATLRRAEIPAANGSVIQLESKAIDAITRADVEAVRAWRRKEQADKGLAGAKGGEVGTNRLLSRLRHVFSWAIAEGHIIDTPFKRGSVSVVRMESSVEGARTRRLEPSATLPDGTVRDGEEARLLKQAGPTCGRSSWPRWRPAVVSESYCPSNGRRFGETRRMRHGGSSCRRRRRKPPKPA